MPRAAETNNPQMIQNRITIVTWAQPSSSKWWWIGVILNSRRGVPVIRRVSLK